MKKIFLIIILISNPMYSNSQNVSDERNIISDEDIIEYPFLDLSVGLGFMWLTQANLTLSAFNYFFIQPRLSYSIVAIERGLMLGYQNRIFDDVILRVGAGYSIGHLTPIDPVMGTTSDDDSWEGIYVRAGAIKKMSSGSILNLNLNVIPGRTPIIFSLNINYVFILL